MEEDSYRKNEVLQFRLMKVLERLQETRVVVWIFHLRIQREQPLSYAFGLSRPIPACMLDLL